jgi:YidC/Oxa1 family membrane protein insertase
MDKRLALALAISVVILFGWWKLFPPPQQQPPPQQPAAQTTAPPAPTAAGQPSAPPPADQAAPAAPAAPEQRVALDTSDARFVLSSLGGTLREVRLKATKFRQNKHDPESGINIVSTTTAETAPLKVTFPKADFRVPELTPFTVSRPTADSVVFRYETDAIALEKRYRVLGRFRLALDVTVENKGAKALNENLAVHMFAKQDPEKKGGGFLSYASADLAEMVCYVSGKAHRENIDSLHKGAKDYFGDVRWAAADHKFFTIAVVPAPERSANERRCGQRAVDEITGEAFLSLASRQVAPGEKSVASFEVYAGPKHINELEQVRPGGQDASLEKVVNVTFAVLALPMLSLLKFFQKLVSNWGLAIILLTLFVKAVTFYPTQRTMLSAKKMQKLAPKMAALKKKYENDKQKLGMETMNLYKVHGVSPLGGCLPTLIQMPIWIALFSTLNYSVELHRSSFLYIADLSAKDPYYIAPLLMGAIMFLQMRMSPAGADPQQQKMMAVMMPIMFTVFSLFLPAGLAIYTLTSYLIGIAQQLYVNHLDRKSGPVVPVKA